MQNEHVVVGNPLHAEEPHFAGEGLTVNVSGIPEIVTVTRGWMEFTEGHGWLTMAGHTQRRFELPMDIILPVPPDHARPYVCFAWNHKTQKAGAYLVDHAIFPSELSNIEILAVRDATSGWVIRHFYHLLPAQNRPARSLMDRPHHDDVHQLFGGHPDTHAHFAPHIHRNRNKLASRIAAAASLEPLPDAK